MHNLMYRKWGGVYNVLLSLLYLHKRRCTKEQHCQQFSENLEMPEYHLHDQMRVPQDGSTTPRVHTDNRTYS